MFVTLLPVALLALQECMHSAGRDVVVVIADDVGWEDLAEVIREDHAPNLLALARSGYVFANCSAGPVCSPTRRMFATGVFYAEQSGSVCGPATGEEPPADIIMLPQAVGAVGCSSALFGKWHIGSNPSGPWPRVVQDRGFTRWGAGLPQFVSNCGGSGYNFWRRVDDGMDRGVVASYQPSAMMASFQNVWPMLPSPRVVVFAPQLAHSEVLGGTQSFHRPPDSLLPGGSLYPPTTDERSKYKAMIAAIDTQVGQILATPGFDLSTDVLVFFGDNGTPKEVAPEPNRAKTTTFRRGVHVPCFFVGAGIPHGMSNALVSVVDLYATICEIQRAAVPGGLDSRSLMPIMLGRTSRVHDYIAFGIRGDPQFGHDDLAVSSLRYKYRRWRSRGSGDSTGRWIEEFYDRALDPSETANLIDVRWLESTIAAHSSFLDEHLP